MKKQLPLEEIQKLFAFVESKYVRYEDLKYELVDHLASAVEDIQEKEPDKSFDNALKETYSRFPITGFTNFVAEKQSALNKYWRRKFFKYYIEFFRLPKIVFLIALIYFIWTAFQYLSHGHILITIVAGVITSMIWNFFKLFKTRKLSQKYSFSVAFHGQQLIPSYILLQLIVQCRIEGVLGTTFPQFAVIIISILTGIYILISYANIMVFPSLFKEEINTKYAHLNIKLAI